MREHITCWIHSSSSISKKEGKREEKGLEMSEKYYINKEDFFSYISVDKSK